MDGNGWDQHKRDVIHRLEDLEDFKSSQSEICRAHNEMSARSHLSIAERISGLEARLAHLEGRLLGFFAAASVLGGVVSLVMQLSLGLLKARFGG